MLKIRHDRLSWSEDDVIAMARVLGADQAVKRRAPIHPSIIKSAKRRGVLLSPLCASLLDRAERDVDYVNELKAREDTFGDPALFPWQRVALNFFHQTNRDAYLNADAPGAGKTAVSIRWANMVGAKRILVVTPNSAKEQFIRAIRRWDMSFLPITLVQGTIAEQLRLLKIQSGWIVTHWESLAHARAAIVKHEWDLVILDEAHRMQNRKAQRTKTAFYLDARYRMAMSGHPYTNNPGELLPILRFLYPDQYRSFWRFFHMHVRGRPLPFGGFEILGTKRPKLLRWELAPFTIRRTQKQLGWRPLERVPRYIDMSARHRAEYKKLQREFFVQLERHKGEGKKILAIPSVLARITRLRQFLVDPGLIGSALPSLKYPVIQENVEELDGPPVIFTSFEQAAIRFQDYMAKHGHRTAIFFGSKAQQERAQRHFFKRKISALIVVTQKGGESLNLGKFGYIIMMDLPWHPRGLEQAEGRVYRPEEGTGKLVACTSYCHVVRGSYEDRRLQIKLEDKNADFQGTFSPKELQELFA